MPEPKSLPTPMKTTLRLENNNTSEPEKYRVRPPRVFRRAASTKTSRQLFGM